VQSVGGNASLTYVTDPLTFATTRTVEGSDALLAGGPMFVRDATYYYGAPDFLNSKCSIVNAATGVTVATVTDIEYPQTCVVDPTGSFLYVGTGIESIAAGNFSIYDVRGSKISNPTYTGNFILNIALGSSKEQANIANFVSQDGVTLGCFAMSSEGAFIIDFTDPSKPTIIASYDQNAAFGDYTVGTQYCEPHAEFGYFWLWDYDLGIADLVQVKTLPVVTSPTTSGTGTGNKTTTAGTGTGTAANGTGTGTAANGTKTGTGTGTTASSSDNSSHLIQLSLALLFSYLILQ